jgi:hypothetical protein
MVRIVCLADIECAARSFGFEIASQRVVAVECPCLARLVHRWLRSLVVALGGASSKAF